MNVYEATQARLKYIFAEFDYVCVSFSGGKDSGVMLNAVIDYVKENDIKNKVGVFHLDYEAQYQMTTDYVDLEYLEKADYIEPYRVCLPIAAQCATSMSQSHWIPWEADSKELWVRPLPENCISEENHDFDFFYQGQWDYDFQEKFGGWLKKKKGVDTVCCLVGNRTDESLNRWRSIHSGNRIHTYKGKKWTKTVSEGVYNVYPIYDWKASDIWTANYSGGYPYNKLYDLYYQAGLSIDQMRVASPFNDCATESLHWYKVIDPNNWGKMIGRVNGVNFAGLYGGTTAMGWRSIKLPDGHTWKSYMAFLLDTLPKATKKTI